MGRLNEGRNDKIIFSYYKRPTIQKTANWHEIINDCNMTRYTAIVLP